MANAIMLDQAKKKCLRLRQTGVGSWKISHFCVGDGRDDGKTSYAPSKEQTQLKHELLRKKVESSAQISETEIEYICRLTESECQNKSLTEIGLVDSDGMLICIKTFQPKLKDNDREMVFKICDTF